MRASVWCRFREAITEQSNVVHYLLASIAITLLVTGFCLLRLPAELHRTVLGMGALILIVLLVLLVAKKKEEELG